MTTKTDNHDPAAKLELRRHFLRKYHADKPPAVFDCCQGSALLWNRLREEFPVRSYWGVDLKPKKGRLKIDSVRILSQPGWTFDVIDIDTYGSPWKHWLALLPNLRGPATVFLTIGQWQMGTDCEILKSIGLRDLRVPAGISVKLHDFSLRGGRSRLFRQRSLHWRASGKRKVPGSVIFAGTIKHNELMRSSSCLRKLL